MTKIEELEQKLNEMNEGLEVGIKKFQEQITDFNNELRIAKEDFLDVLNKCKKELAESKESKKEGKWLPKEGKEYWYRDVDGGIYFDYWNNHIFDRLRYKHTLLFPTKESCERYWHFMDTVKEKSYSFSEEEWEDESIAKYLIEYYYLDKEFCVEQTWHYKELGTIYFKDEESAQYIIDNFKDELMDFFIKER